MDPRPSVDKGHVQVGRKAHNQTKCMHLYRPTCQLKPDTQWYSCENQTILFKPSPPPSPAFPVCLQYFHLSACVCILAASPREGGLLVVELGWLWCVWECTRPSWKHDLWEASLARPWLTAEQLAQRTPINCTSLSVQLQKKESSTRSFKG